MYRLNKIDRVIDHTMYRESLRRENKIKFHCPLTRIVKIRKSPFYRGVDLWTSFKVEHCRAENKEIQISTEKPALTLTVARPIPNY